MRSTERRTRSSELKRRRFRSQRVPSKAAWLRRALPVLTLRTFRLFGARFRCVANLPRAVLCQIVDRGLWIRTIDTALEPRNAISSIFHNGTIAGIHGLLHFFLDFFLPRLYSVRWSDKIIMIVIYADFCISEILYMTFSV